MERRARRGRGDRQRRRGKGNLAGAGGIAPQHLLGGTIMGTSASNSVVNSYGQTHELVNLHVAGCGIFPTESSANPTFTLNALSLRGAEQLATNWNSIASWSGRTPSGRR